MDTYGKMVGALASEDPRLDCKIADLVKRKNAAPEGSIERKKLVRELIDLRYSREVAVYLIEYYDPVHWEEYRRVRRCRASVLPEVLEPIRCRAVSAFPGDPLHRVRTDAVLGSDHAHAGAILPALR
jgi:hypothetical protein